MQMEIFDFSISHDFIELTFILIHNNYSNLR